MFPKRNCRNGFRTELENSNRAGDASAAYAAVAVGVLAQVLLVIRLCIEEFSERGNLCCDLAEASLRQQRLVTLLC